MKLTEKERFNAALQILSGIVSNMKVPEIEILRMKNILVKTAYGLVDELNNGLNEKTL